MVGPVDVRVRETLPEVARMGAIMGALEDVSILVDVVAAVETETEKLWLLLLLVLLVLEGEVVVGDAVTVGLIVMVAVEAAAQPTPAHV